MHREPDAGLDPGSPRSRPGPKAGAKPLHHPGIPDDLLLIPIPPMITDAEIPPNTRASHFQQYIKGTGHHNQVGFVPRMLGWFDIHKSMDVMHSINRRKGRNT